MDGGNYWFYSKDYYLDDRRGVCEDCDARCVRYIRRDNDKVYKMKAGKIMRNCLESCKLTEKYCEQVIIYYCELFAEQWRSHVESNYGDGLELHVNDNFCDIYDGYCLKGDFGSCMTGNNQYSFYENAVKAKAAYLLNPCEEIVARCVIFTEVHSKDSDRVYRLAERQYASGQDNVLKRVLIDKLIQAGEIDGYKEVGVDCHSPRKFVLNDGTSLRDERLWIECELDWGNTISYQDSFKWFDYELQRADNYERCDLDLAVTDSTLEGMAFDDYHDRYCRETTTVYVWNSGYEVYDEYQCDVDDMSDFYYCNRERGYYDDAYWSSYESDYIPRDRAVWSDRRYDYLWRDLSDWCEEAEDYFPSDDFDRYFDEWKEENWEWDELNNEFVKETVEAYLWNDIEYEPIKVSVEYAEQYLVLFDGEYYSELNKDGIPFHLVEELEECEAV